MASQQPINAIDTEVLPKLDPLFVEYYNKELASRLATHQVPLDQVRANLPIWEPQPVLHSGPNGDAAINNYTIDSTDNDISSTFKLRVYHPSPSLFGSGPYAAHINFHGGGWMFGGLGTDAGLCMRVRDRIPLVIVDVDYRLCPESDFGENINDAWAAFLWIRQNALMLNIGLSSLSIGGTSAGAHLACIVQHRARDLNIDLKLLVAIVPTLADHDQYTQPEDSPWPSYSEYRNAPLLNWTRMSYFQQHVFPKSKAKARSQLPDWWISPLRAPNFKGLCTTFVGTAECDPLRDEGEGYAKKLVDAGVLVTLRRYQKVPHPFMQLISVLPQAKQYEEDLISALTAAHSSRMTRHLDVKKDSE